MKRITALLALTFLLTVATSLCFASMRIVHVSKERARELGMKVRFTGNAPNEVWVELEFKAEGKLKDFDHVSLEIRDGDKFMLGYTPLREKRTDSGSVAVGFMANRAYLDKVTLMVVTGHPMNMTGHELRMKDFVELGKPR